MNYSVFTFITNNYEIVREIDNPQDNVEYILVTDNKDLKSNTWKVVYEPLLDNDWMSGVAKAFILRYNAYKYVSNDIFVRMDASIKITYSIDSLVEEFVNGGYDTTLLYHFNSFEDKNFIDEYNVWIDYTQQKGVTENDKLFFIQKQNELGWDENWKSGLCEIGFQICKKSDVFYSFNKEMLDLLFPTKTYFDCCHLDQCLHNLLLETKYNVSLKTWLITDQLFCSKYLKIYAHGTDEENTWRQGIFSEYHPSDHQDGFWRNNYIRLDFFDKE